MNRILLVISSDSQNDCSKWVVIVIELVLLFVFAETVTGRRMQTLASDIPTCSPENRNENLLRPRKMTHRDSRRCHFRGKESYNKDLFLEINDSYSSKQIYFCILNVNDVN